MSRVLIAAMVCVIAQFAFSQNIDQSESTTSSIGYPTVAAAFEALTSKEGVVISNRDGWTIIDDNSEDARSLWSFTPSDHPAHPAAVKRTVYEQDGAVWIDMKALCQAGKEPCDALIGEFEALNTKIRESVSKRHPRHDEAVAFASRWLALLEAIDYEKSYSLLSDTFKSNLTIGEWQSSVSARKQSLGELESRRLRRVVWYQDPTDAPLPGTYAAVEFDSVYEKTDQHFQYLILHSLNGEPFRVMRHESTVVMRGQAEDANQ